jgi:hypothetical protein
MAEDQSNKKTNDANKPKLHGVVTEGDGTTLVPPMMEVEEEGSEPSRTTAQAAAGDWQRQCPTETRATVLGGVTNLLEMTKALTVTTISRNHIPYNTTAVASSLEEHLFQAATSLEIYSDPATIMARMREIVRPEVTWQQTGADDAIRLEMIGQIYYVLRRRVGYDARLGLMARGLEHKLYKTSRSRVAYADHNTLKDRLNQIALYYRALDRQKRRKIAVDQRALDRQNRRR